MVLTDELCDKLCAAAREKSKEIGIDISFAISDENGLPRAYRRYGDALVLSITLVPGKAYTAAVTPVSYTHLPTFLIIFSSPIPA